MLRLETPTEYKYNQKVVVIGGGSGQFQVLRGLVERNNPKGVTAVPTTWDDGQSSGRARYENGVLPAGDERRCVFGMITDKRTREIARKIFNDRLEGFPALSGHSLGNLMINVLEREGGSNNIKALEDMCYLFGVEGKVLPVSLNPLVLNTETTFGDVLEGEHHLDERWKVPGYNPKNKIENLYFTSPAIPNPEVIKAIYEAEKIVIAMGSLGGSILPHFLVPGIREAILEAKGELFYIQNIFTEKGQTDSRAMKDAYGHIKELCGFRYLRDGSRINYIIAVQNQVQKEVREIYQRAKQYQVKVNKAKIRSLAFNAVFLDDPKLPEYEAEQHIMRHNPNVLGEMILNPKQFIS